MNWPSWIEQRKIIIDGNFELLGLETPWLDLFNLRLWLWNFDETNFVYLLSNLLLIKYALANLTQILRIIWGITDFVDIFDVDWLFWYEFPTVRLFSQVNLWNACARLKVVLHTVYGTGLVFLRVIDILKEFSSLSEVDFGNTLTTVIQCWLWYIEKLGSLLDLKPFVAVFLLQLVNQLGSCYFVRVIILHDPLDETTLRKVINNYVWTSQRFLSKRLTIFNSVLRRIIELLSLKTWIKALLVADRVALPLQNVIDDFEVLFLLHHLIRDLHVVPVIFEIS